MAKNLHQIEEFGEEFTRQSVKERYAMLTEPGQHIQLSTLEVRTTSYVNYNLKIILIAICICNYYVNANLRINCFIPQGEILGAALRTNRESKNPVFVSVGTGISLDTGIKVVR